MTHPTAALQQRAYALLGELLLRGPTPEHVNLIIDMPPLDATLHAAFGNPVDADRAAAAHARLFDLNIFPFEGVFTRADSMVGGEATQQLRAWYASRQFQPPNEGPEHAGTELLFLAHLCGQLVRAPHAAIEAELEQALGAFLDQHLGRWMAPLVVATQRSGDPFHTQLLNLVWELLVGQRTALAERVPPGSTAEASPARGGHASATADREPASPGTAVNASHAEPNDAPEAAADARSTARADLDAELAIPDLRAEATGLRDIEAYLLAPARSGWFLDREHISAVANAESVPHGFGSRNTLLHNTLESAARYECLGPLLERLQVEIRAWLDAYATLAGSPAEARTVASGWVWPWQQRLHRAYELVEAMRTRGNRIASELPST